MYKVALSVLIVTFNSSSTEYTTCCMYVSRAHSDFMAHCYILKIAKNILLACKGIRTGCSSVAAGGVKERGWGRMRRIHNASFCVDYTGVD